MRVLAAVVVALVFVLGARPAAADGAWLDAPTAQWNRPGANLPRAFSLSGFTFNAERCAESARPVETPEDAAVAAAGWWLVGGYSGGWGLRVVTGAAGWDGMCRPIGYQIFVFADGPFVGTLAPAVMNSREDGAAGQPIIVPPRTTRFGGVAVQYRRYAPTDPLCCPSGEAVRTFRVASSPAGNWLMVDGASG